MIVRRPIGAWAREIRETGLILSAEVPGDVVWYALLEGDFAVQLMPSAAGGWTLSEVGPREKVVILGRYPNWKLRFPAAPLEDLWSAQTRLSPQRIEAARIKLVYNGPDPRRLLNARGQAVDRDWDLNVAPRNPADSDVTAPVQDGASLKVGITREGRYVVIGDPAPLLAAERARQCEIEADVVVRHPAWEKFRERLISYGGSHRGRLYQRVKHPDLIDLEASHDNDRLPIIRTALDGFDPLAKRLLDIGAHWGQMSRAMEDLGFDVTAVEHSPSSVKTATYLRNATESHYEIWQGSIFEYPDIDKHDVILGLNIFHHFLKRKQTFDGLVSILERSKAEIIIFAAHAYGRGSDFLDAYRNFPPAEFASFVSEKSRLPNIEHVGTSHDGRNLYKLSR